MDEKSMVGRAQMGRCDRRLRQAFPRASDEILGGLPALQVLSLPAVGRRAGLTSEGRTTFESFTKSVTLQKVFRQEGDDPEQIKFREALMRLREYKSSQEDHTLFSTRFWDQLSPTERDEFNDTLHLLPTKEAVNLLNTRRLSSLGKPVVRCLAKHNGPEAKKGSDEDAEGLQKEVLLAEGAKVMITRNVWTSK
ncbi:hypothetical protein B0H10DRAFT_2307024, partial [Mycena sp. CBHHK59/15]